MPTIQKAGDNQTSPIGLSAQALHREQAMHLKRLRWSRQGCVTAKWHHGKVPLWKGHLMTGRRGLAAAPAIASMFYVFFRDFSLAFYGSMLSSRQSRSLYRACAL
jgi:hypothetical protein